MEIDVKIKLLNNSGTSPVTIPSYATRGSAGMDLCACLDKPILVKAGEIVRIPTGIALQLPDKYVGGFIFPRSGLSSKNGISLINCVGVLDSDYTGEIVCPVVNHSNIDYTINHGDRIAQIVFLPVCIAKLSLVDELSSTERGEGGFGSTGV